MLRLRVGAFEDFAGEVVEDGLGTLLAWTAGRLRIGSLEEQDETSGPSLDLLVQAIDLCDRPTSLRSDARDAVRLRGRQPQLVAGHDRHRIGSA